MSLIPGNKVTVEKMLGKNRGWPRAAQGGRGIGPLYIAVPSTRKGVNIWRDGKVFVHNWDAVCDKLS